MNDVVKGDINKENLTVSKGKSSCDKRIFSYEYEVTSNNYESNNDRRSEGDVNKLNISKSKIDMFSTKIIPSYES